jgi:hypothetical protein
MMRDRDGNLRGFCYIDFADEAGALAGLKEMKGVKETYYMSKRDLLHE